MRFPTSVRWSIAAMLACAGMASAQSSATRPFVESDTTTAWTLVWADEFNGTAVDETKWEILDMPRREALWARKDVSLDGAGNLELWTRAPEQENGKYSTGAVRTKGRYERAFGFFEARMRFPESHGHWPAFWLFTQAETIVGNDGRDGTEVDIMEKPTLTGEIQHNLHWDGYGEAHRGTGKVVTAPELANGWHTIGLDWTPTEYVFYVDGKETWRTSAGGVCQVPMYIKFTEEIGPWSGDIATAKLPDRFLVDYVRVFERTPLPLPENAPR